MPLRFFDVAELVLECVCERMTVLAGEVEGYPGCSCLQYVSAGEPAIDCCVHGAECEDSGVLTVHLEDVFASDNFPARTAGFEPCKAASWVAAVVVTASRCAPMMDAEGNPAPAEELTANARLMAIDQYAILTALGCCVVTQGPAAKRVRRVQITGTRALLSDGGCAAIEVRALVDAGVVCCPPEGS